MDIPTDYKLDKPVESKAKYGEWTTITEATPESKFTVTRINKDFVLLHVTNLKITVLNGNSIFLILEDVEGEMAVRINEK